MPYDYHTLTERRNLWKSKRILKRLYRRWYGMIAEALRPGFTIEAGAGSGNFKEFFPEVFSTDILLVPWLDLVMDALDLPFKKETVDNLVLFDVLHHLTEPMHFFAEAQRVLKPKGRIVLMEPYISGVSYWVYRLFHHEGLNDNIDPFRPRRIKTARHHFQGNQAIPTLIFEKNRDRFISNFPDLIIIKQMRTDFALYPLSGGFHHPSFCPLFLFPALEYLERLLSPLNRLLAFRLFVVLEKAG